MDIVLEVFDTYFADRAFATLAPATKNNIPFQDNWANQTLAQSSPWIYTPASQFLPFEPSEYATQSAWSRDNTVRQGISFFIIMWLFGAIIYFVFSTLSYIFVFDKDTFKHPKYLKNQVRLEIAQTLRALPVMSILTVPFFLGEVKGYAKLYDHPDDAPFWAYNILQFPLFVLFTDFFIYWIHRYLHHPLIYKRLHKPHHKWIMPTPYASHAFHPVDGWAQSVPYHVYPFLFPLNKYAYILLFTFINFWTVFIHDGEYIANSPIINGAACHTMHHLYFNYNYGQFTTLWDRVGGSYRKPNEELFRRETKFDQKEWGRQVKEMETIQKVVEGEDDRTYGGDAKMKKKQ